MSIAGALTAIAAALVLSAFVEALLEYVMGIWWKPLADETRKKVIMAVGLVLGIALAISFRVDLLASLGFAPGIVGQILTGAVVGRGSSYLHDFWNKITGAGGGGGGTSGTATPPGTTPQ